ncbi:hypothetical protein CgunFtcFv8_023832 [Champsocephalus gunnari]|uniref:Uncharacterized protein n=1 Tax=Champsocephalus gunnari TaxID=52237 RepID=A0AAN8HLK4_CHAGU|nr:hypothetical protein CgunFtcFv8_023832 [Champsocephalus gunnari]
MHPQTPSLRVLLFLGLWQTGRRCLASAPELEIQPQKIGADSGLWAEAIRECAPDCSTSAKRSSSLPKCHFNQSSTIQVRHRN